MHRIRSWARETAHGGSKQPSTLPVTNSGAGRTDEKNGIGRSNSDRGPSTNNGTAAAANKNAAQPAAAGTSNTPDAGHAASTASQAEGEGAVVEAGPPPNIFVRCYRTTMKILCHSWFNILLVFVPAGIAVAQVPGMPPGAVFAINAVAIIPLAGLLSHATESVARKLGDAVGALLNVTFGNAVELIIFIIALAKNEIRIVQASLLGSILANLLLILGMAFLLGGLRFREQIYNSTVTQMSACLLSLSVISLVLPTAFHASFSNSDKADEQSLKISRGTSVILLLVYIIYLLFQLKSHAYMYESTPQHIIDEESTPGPAAAWLDTSSSESSSSSDTDSDGSSQHTVSKRVKRAIRRRRRKSSVTSVDTLDGQTRTSSFGNSAASPMPDNASKSGESSNGPVKPVFPRLHTDASEEVIEEEPPKRHRKHHHKKRKHRKERKARAAGVDAEKNASAVTDSTGGDLTATRSADASGNPTNGEPRRVDFADNVTNMDGTTEPTAEPNGRRPFNRVRGLSFKPVTRLAPPVFTTPDPNTPGAGGRAEAIPRVRYGIRRTNSLPDRLSQNYQYRAPGAMMPAHVPQAALVEGTDPETGEHEEDLSRLAAIVLLLVSTALVATCAEFMVDSINAVVETSPVGEIFIGLIILPIVGNAAEHVTALTVAMKNKMDLAIGVAVGSSIQIAIFITPLVVILGWIMNREMTLYFTLFETVCLFVSAFIVNFLVLDGRSNYLEGALLCATYIIIAVVAFFYPDGAEASNDW